MEQQSSSPCHENYIDSNNNKNSQPPPHSNSKKRPRSCYHCGNTNHRAKNCPTAKCQLCGKLGHSTGGCPSKPPPPVDRGQFSAIDVKAAPSFTFCELFAGMGGFRVALDKLGGHCVFASEVDRFCRRNYEANFGGDRPAGDITQIPSDDIPHHDVLVAGFPCQPFSSSGTQQGMKDAKGLLFREIVRIVQHKQPKAFLLENVRGLLLHDKGKTLKIVVEELEECGYKVQWEILDVVKLLPQERARLYIVGIRSDLCNNIKKNGSSFSYKFPNIPDLKRGVQDILEQDLSQSDLATLTLTPHQVSKVQSQNYTQQHPEARFLSNLASPTKTLQSSYTSYMVGSQFVPVYFDDNNNLPQQDPKWRRFSPREAARLQGFPETFVLCKERPYHLIGNAVAPPMIAMITAPILSRIGVHANPVGDNDDNQKDSSTYTNEWGWSVAKDMLLEACPNDKRRVDLQRKLEAVSGLGDS